MNNSTLKQGSTQLYYGRFEASGGHEFDLLMYATSPQEAAQQLVDHYELEEAADLESWVSVAVVPSPISGVAGPIDWNFLASATHIEPGTLIFAEASDDEEG